MGAVKTDPDFSKKRILDEQKLRKIVHLIVFERYTLRDAAEAMGVSHMTVYRALQKTEFALARTQGRLYEKILNMR